MDVTVTVANIVALDVEKVAKGLVRNHVVVHANCHVIEMVAQTSVLQVVMVLVLDHAMEFVSIIVLLAVKQQRKI